MLVAAAIAASATEIPQGERRSGYSFMAPETQAIQNDDTANPGMLWVLDGEKLWNSKAGDAAKACADCHHDARTSMKGVAARYPAFDKELGRPVNLEQRVNLCRTRHQQATPLPYESRDLLALSAYVAQQSRGAAIVSGADPQLAPFVARGPRVVHAAAGPAQSRLHQLPRRQLGQASGGLGDHASDIRPAIRCTGWSGNRSDRCSAGCAAASSASARKLTITARRNWSNSSSI